MREIYDTPDNFTVEVASALSKVEDYWERLEYFTRIFRDNDPVPDLLAKYGPKGASGLAPAPPAPV